MAKRGLECEGEFQGIRTLFCSAEEFILTQPKFLKSFPHIYISDHENKLLLDGPIFVDLDIAGTKVTIERTKFDKAPYWINIMLYVDNESFWNLRGNDQIKFSRELNVYAIAKKSMIYTDPCQFQSDVEAKL